MTGDGNEVVADTVRTRRVELTDAEGRVRGVLGELEPNGGGERPVGLSLYTPEGERRVSVLVGREGAWALFEQGGNAVAQLGLYERTSNAFDTRVFLHLSDVDGTPVIRWRVADDGSLIEERWDERSAGPEEGEGI